ncbi:Probable NreB protein [hydrothermal vent metagenome]|uniref:Probable NreB protein n=1 Tax=hydrothermal vent metagenome TaxID=652676 RepID=A0A3B0TSQ6_9ZZZZ
MLKILANRTYRHLFGAQIIALLGTGLATVALGLMAWQIAGENAGMVLGTAFAIKMIAYVILAPIASAFADRVPRRAMLVTLDLIRAGVALALPFVTEIWQIYILIFFLQAASAGFTPTFQATIPDVLPDEEEYTKALSLSRLAYDLESLISPMLAVALLSVVSFPVLFYGTVIGFVASAALVASTTLPTTSVPAPSPPSSSSQSDPAPSAKLNIWERTTRGIRIYLATPRLRGLLALNLAVASAGAMVIVNTVVIVQTRFGLEQSAVAWALAAFGGGSMAGSLILPWLLQNIPDRTVMIAGAGLLVVGTALGPLAGSLAGLAPLWLLIGFGYSLTMTPSGRLLRRSAHAQDRPAIFAAQFALSHVCWLITYPIAGFFGARFGLDATFIVLAAIAALGLVAATRVWPASESETLAHKHPDLSPQHPHLREYGIVNHRHAIVVDDLHRNWPRLSGHIA